MVDVWINPSTVEGKPMWLTELLGSNGELLGVGYGARVDWTFAVTDGHVDRAGVAHAVRVGRFLFKFPPNLHTTVSIGDYWSYRGRLLGG